MEALDVVVKRELQRMRTHSEWSYLTVSFVSDPAFDELLTKHITFQQEVMIRFQSFQGVVQ